MKTEASWLVDSTLFTLSRLILNTLSVLLRANSVCAATKSSLTAETGPSTTRLQPRLANRQTFAPIRPISRTGQVHDKLFSIWRI